jgi:hypothetical protein
MKFMLIALLAVFCTAGFTSCSSMGINTDLQKIEASCASASASIKVLSAAASAGQLSPAQMSGVIAGAETIEPVCSAKDPPTLDSVKYEAFRQAVAELGSLAAQSK